MKKLFFLCLTILCISFSGCEKEYTKSEYIVAVSGEDYTDEVRIKFQSNRTFDEKSDGHNAYLNLINGEAIVEGYKKDMLKFYFKPYIDAPDFQVTGFAVHIEVFSKKSNGGKGSKVAETDLVCGTSNDGEAFLGVGE